MGILLAGCNAGSTTPSQQNDVTINPSPIIIHPVPVITPLPVPVTPIPRMESLIFYPPIESLVPPIESLTAPPKTYFVGYYPESCVPNNAESNVAGNCQCIQDPITKDIWYANTTIIPDTWAINSYLAQKLNNESACGLSEGWNLPGLDQLAQLNSLLIDVPIESKAAWMNNNGFYNIRNILYFGTISISPFAYGMNITNGNVIDDINTTNAKGWGIAVNRGG